jgi:hypothetical protein
MCELGDEELSVRQPVAREQVAAKFVDIGWYEHSPGRKRYGIINKNNDEESRPRSNDSWLYEELV